MRARLKKLIRIAAFAVGALACVLLLLIGVLNTGAGQDALAALIRPLSGGKISVTGLRGRFPQSLRIANLQLADAQGPWLVIENLALDWSPLRLLSGEVDVAKAEAGRVAVARLPVPDKDDSGETNLAVEIRALHIARLETAAVLSGKPGIFTLQGRLHYASKADAGALLAVTRLDAPDVYRIDGTWKDGVIGGTARVREGTQGLLAGLLGLDAVGAIGLDAQAGGKAGANAIAFTLDAGPLQASGKGVIDLSGDFSSARADVDFSAAAPAMILRSDLSWQALAVEGHVHGPLRAPDIAAHAEVKSLAVAGGAVAAFTGDVQGKNGGVDFTADADTVRLPGAPDLFARAPVVLRGHADLSGPVRTARLALSHPLLAMDAQLEIGTASKLDMNARIPSLAPFLAAGGADVQGRATLAAHVLWEKTGLHLALDGTAAATGGHSPLARLMGPNAHFTVKTDSAGSDITISDLRFDGAAARARLSGTMKAGMVAVEGNAALSDMSLLLPGFSGNLDVSARARGPLDTAKWDATATGLIGAAGFSRQRLTLAVHAVGLPQPASGNFHTEGGFAGAPVALDGSFSRAARATRISLQKGDWKSLSARADVTLTGGKTMGGRATLRFARLADLAPILGIPLEGGLDAALDLTAGKEHSLASLRMTGRHLRAGEITVENMMLTGKLDDPLGTASAALNLDASGIMAAGFSANASAQMNGPLRALNARLVSELRDPDGTPAKIAATATWDTKRSRVLVSAFDAAMRGQAVALAAPALVDFADGLAMDKILVHSGKAELSLAGRILPKLDATLAARNITARLISAFIPIAAGEGTLSADAKLGGTLAAPQGTVLVTGRGLRPLGVPNSIALASLNVHAALRGQSAAFDAAMTAGTGARLTIAGDAPFDPAQAMNIKASGNADLALLSPFLSAEGRAVRGQLTLDAAVTGTMAAPRLAGTARVTGGEVQDYVQGLRVHDIALTAEAQDGVVRIAHLSGRAGPGTVTGSGTIGLTAEGMPVDIAIEMKNARPLASDALSATLDAKLALTGKAKERLNLSGAIAVPRGEINLPDTLPQSVAVLDVRRPGDMSGLRPAPAAAPVFIGLDLAIASPGQFFVRGHGLDAEVQGNIHAGGSAAAPLVTGDFTLRRGTLTLAGTTLNFTSGKVSFDGGGVSGRIDPALDFIAQTVSGGITAQLEISGHASAPKVTLSSTPTMPQDEVLARLLFQQSVKELSPFQLAEIAQAAASLGGVGTGFNPVASVRKSLGLDLLSVGSESTAGGSGTETTLEAGKYVAPGIYVGAKQGTAGTTQAQVQVDLTGNLKARATVNAGTSATVTQGASQDEAASSVGLTYQFEY